MTTEALERATAQQQIARENLIAVIQEAHDAGMSLRAIARIVGLSHESVRKLANHN